MHLLGVTHGSPTNPRAVHEVASAVQPDAFAMEGTEEYRGFIRRAAGSTHLQPLLDKVIRAAGFMEGTEEYRGFIRRAARSKHLQPLLDKVSRTAGFMEGTEEYSGFIRRAAGSMHLQPLLDKVRRTADPRMDRSELLDGRPPAGHWPEATSADE